MISKDVALTLGTCNLISLLAGRFVLAWLNTLVQLLGAYSCHLRGTRRYPWTVPWSAAGRWKTYEWRAKQTRNILNLVTDVESSFVVDRKNEMKKTIKNKKKRMRIKVPMITFTVAAVGEFIRTRPFEIF